MKTIDARPKPLQRLREAIAWRTYALGGRVRPMIGVREQQWARVVMDEETDRLMQSFDHRNAHALEISGDKWQNFGFKSYRSIWYPEFDVCAGPLEVDAFDVVIAEQVFEHLLWPYRALRNVCSMIRPGGRFLITTPFLFRIHEGPFDCSRWTELGMKHFLAEGGFEFASIQTGSWGNERCVRTNLRRTVRYGSWWHSLRNEPKYPVVVWALARKPGPSSEPTGDAS